MLSPVHFLRQKPRQVSCYAFFKWWLLLSLHPYCLRFKTPFDTLSMNFGTLTIVSLVRVTEHYLTQCPSLLFQSQEVLSWKGCRRKIPLHVLSVLYPTDKLNKAILRHISTGTSHRQVRVAFHPYSQIIQMHAHNTSSGLHSPFGELHLAHEQIIQIRVLSK